MKKASKIRGAQSRKIFSHKKQELNKILILFQSMKNQEEMSLIFQVFFTEKERQILMDRYQILEALFLSQMSQREMAAQFQLSISKITAGSKAVQRLSPEDYEFISQHMRKI